VLPVGLREWRELPRMEKKKMQLEQQEVRVPKKMEWKKREGHPHRPRPWTHRERQ
jgi:hypothetical protein